MTIVIKSEGLVDWRLKVVHDDTCESPREWEEESVLYLVDKFKHTGELPYSNWEATREVLWDDVHVLPVYVYQHGGIKFQCKPFSCPWDSGQAGVITILKDKVEGWDYDKVVARLEAEVEIFSEWVSGNCYGYRIEKVTKCGCSCPNCEAETVERYDSCYGFIGSGKEVAQHMLDNMPKEVGATLEQVREALENVEY